MKTNKLGFPKENGKVIGIILVTTVILSFFWGICFQVLPTSLSFAHRYKVASYGVTSLHASFCFIMALVALQVQPPWHTWRAVLALMQGCFCYDLIFLCFTPTTQSYSTTQILMILHHLAVLLLSSYKEIRSLFLMGMLSELAVPFLYTSFALKKIYPHLTTTTPFLALTLFTTLLYFLCRVCNFTYLLWRASVLLYHHEKHPFRVIVFLSFFYITLINYYWFSNLLYETIMVMRIHYHF